jgi:glycosyltransferase involved in cell wall biosynthesis
MRICYVGDPENTLIHRFVKYPLSRGHEIHLIAAYLQPYRIELRRELDGVIVHQVSSQRKRKLAFGLDYLGIRSLLRHINPDLVHIHSLTPVAMLVALSGFHPVIFTPWGADVLHTPFQSRVIHVLTRLALRRVDAIIAQSNAMVAETLKFSGPKPYFDIQWGVNTDVFRPGIDTSQLRQELGIPLTHQVVLSPRQFGYKYNIDVIMRAASTVLGALPDTTFIFKYYITQGDLESELGSLVEELEIQETVRLVGRDRSPGESHARMAEYFNLSDVFVSIPSWDGGTPATILEGLACGVTPIVSDIPTNTEWITHRYNGLVVPDRDPRALAESLISALSHSGLRRKFAERNVALAREKAEYNQEMEKIERVYHHYVGSS